MLPTPENFQPLATILQGRPDFKTSASKRASETLSTGQASENAIAYVGARQGSWNKHTAPRLLPRVPRFVVAVFFFLLFPPHDCCCGIDFLILGVGLGHHLRTASTPELSHLQRRRPSPRCLPRNPRRRLATIWEFPNISGLMQRAKVWNHEKNVGTARHMLEHRFEVALPHHISRALLCRGSFACCTRRVARCQKPGLWPGDGLGSHL